MGRLLHYFAHPMEEEDVEKKWEGESDWCGWHNDHSALTGLTSAIYIDDAT